MSSICQLFGSQARVSCHIVRRFIPDIVASRDTGARYSHDEYIAVYESRSANGGQGPEMLLVSKRISGSEAQDRTHLLPASAVACSTLAQYRRRKRGIYGNGTTLRDYTAAITFEDLKVLFPS